MIFFAAFVADSNPDLYNRISYLTVSEKNQKDMLQSQETNGIILFVQEFFRRTLALGLRKALLPAKGNLILPFLGNALRRDAYIVRRCLHELKEKSRHRAYRTAVSESGLLECDQCPEQKVTYRN